MSHVGVPWNTYFVATIKYNTTRLNHEFNPLFNVSVVLAYPNSFGMLKGAFEQTCEINPFYNRGSPDK